MAVLLDAEGVLLVAEGEAEEDEAAGRALVCGVEDGACLFLLRSNIEMFTSLKPGQTSYQRLLAGARGKLEILAKTLQRTNSLYRMHFFRTNRCWRS
ncbi:hypothetical protein [Pseudohalioglobus lutimaris]|uniref:Uncharacterized protein n=1 Tax=Pseudohalioglobus lutimaris TaxID=1737061 RepID=A0A2N5WY53_9GAMM|nr:hypothetical protein [Pseudohalioglobus lutimaris]PLW67157.1 hypothetical protein C0039_18280 [Pseudohalioglobus lutimaris]